MLLSTLIEMRADPNDLVQQSEPVLLLAPQTPLLHICAALSHNEAVQVLLAARADIGSTDGFGSTALLWAAAVNNVEGIEILSQAGCDFKSPNMVGYSPFVAASVIGCIEAMTKLLPHASRQELNLALHKTILHGSGSADVMLILVNAGADVNCQLHTPLISPFGILFSMLSIRNHWRQSTLSFLCLPPLWGNPAHVQCHHRVLRGDCCSPVGWSMYGVAECTRMYRPRLGEGIMCPGADFVGDRIRRTRARSSIEPPPFSTGTDLGSVLDLLSI